MAQFTGYLYLRGTPLLTVLTDTGGDGEDGRHQHCRTTVTESPAKGCKDKQYQGRSHYSARTLSADRKACAASRSPS